MITSAKVTTRNFLKTEVQCFQMFNGMIGVPKGTNSPLLVKNTLSQTQSKTRLKSAFYRGNVVFCPLDTARHKRPPKHHVGLRIGYELPQDFESFEARNIPHSTSENSFSKRKLNGGVMAKRFTETSKWGKESFADLPMKMKLVWIYLCDNCDHAGIWDMNMSLMSFQIGAKVSLSEIQQSFGDKVEFRGENKISIPSFVSFQYGALNPNNKVHQSVLSRLEKLAPTKDLSSSCQGAKDKDKDKDKEKDKEGECEGKPFSKLRLAEIYQTHYPLKKGKEKGLARAAIQIKTETDAELLVQAIEAYKADLAKNNTESKYIKHFDTFMSSWRDWLDPDAGKVTKLKKPPSDYSFLEDPA